MNSFLAAAGLTPTDELLLTYAPLLGLIGSVIRVLMIRNSLEVLPERQGDSHPFNFWFAYSRFNGYLAWGVVGSGSGLLIALLFLGSLDMETSITFRVFAVALLAGYGAPSLWKRQEDTVAAIVAARLQGPAPNAPSGKKPDTS